MRRVPWFAACGTELVIAAVVVEALAITPVIAATGIVTATAQETETGATSASASGVPESTAATEVVARSRVGGIDPTPCLERHDGSVDDPDWKRFAASRSSSDGRDTDSHGAPTEEIYIERAAALCIARAAGLGDGDVPWHARLLYLGDEGHVVWIVTRTRRAGDGGGKHRELFIDAVTGRALRTSSYTTRPR